MDVDQPGGTTGVSCKESIEEEQGVDVMDQSITTTPMFHLPVWQTVYAKTWPDSHVIDDEESVLGGETPDEDLDDEEEEELLEEELLPLPATVEK